MSKWKNRPDGRTVRRHKIPPGQQWTWWTIEMLESPAYQALSLSERRIIDRIRIELAHHAGQENGKLPVTFRDFHKYGVRFNSIAPAIRGAQALGFIRVTQWGVASNSEFKIPTKFALTHLATNDDQDAATNDWQAIKTLKEAKTIAKTARTEPSRYSRFKKRRASLRYRNGIESATETVLRAPDSSIPKRYHCDDTETVALSISRGGSGETPSKAKPEPEHGIGHNQDLRGMPKDLTFDIPAACDMSAYLSSWSDSALARMPDSLAYLVRLAEAGRWKH